MENRKLPNATAVLVLGILSVLFCWCYGIIGIILSIIAIVLAQKDLALYNQEPQNYSNYGNLKAGRIMAIIGLILSVITIIYIIAIVRYIGIENLNDPEKLQDIMKNLQKG
mgnify:CR=1 FL=1|tara:strand:- start:923 stop:1255 length:333 start_codon:yes stop_codon:yes gene_type:complete